MRVTKMAAPLGAIVEDLDVRTVGEEEAATLNQLFGEHHVLVFPDARAHARMNNRFRSTLGRTGALSLRQFAWLPEHHRTAKSRQKTRRKSALALRI